MKTLVKFQVVLTGLILLVQAMNAHQPPDLIKGLSLCSKECQSGEYVKEITCADEHGEELRYFSNKWECDKAVKKLAEEAKENAGKDYWYHCVQEDAGPCRKWWNGKFGEENEDEV